MGQSVDTKIVELKFNNDNFADKVDSTLTKLEQLNKDIEQVGFTEAFKNLGKSVKDVDTRGITEGVQESQKAFSKLEVVGMTALVNLSNAAVNFGKKMAKRLIAPITQGVMQGGLARARNIEQATFSFEGQKIGKSKGNEAKSYYEEVMNAVLGTSYSYDVAAKAASQLAASNVGVIDTEKKLADGSTITSKVLDSSMTDALLGIAGVAAMTGSDFDSIAQIFTRVAGQGRVMANDLNSISSRGLNAAAVLAKYLDTTEEDVRDMVTKGKVSFEDFSNAMTQAFGTHAKDSTLTFQGALDDVNAALARIGADFYGPALTAGRDILNSITPLVDVIHSKLNPALSSTTNIITEASGKMSQYLDMLSYMLNMTDASTTTSDWINEHMNAWTNIADLYKKGNVKDAIDGLEKASAAWKGMDGQGINGRQMVADYYNLASNVDLLSHYLKISKDEAKALVDEGSVGAKELNKVIDGMLKDGTIGWNEFYKSFHKLWSESENLMGMDKVQTFFDEYVRSCIAAGQGSERFTQHIQTFFKIYDGLTSLFSSLKTIAAGFLDIIMTLAQHLAPLGTLVLNFTAAFANFIVGLADAISTSETFANVIDSIVNLLTKLFTALHLNKVVDIALSGITKTFDFLANAIERVHTGIGKVIVTFNNTIGKVIDKIHEILSNAEEVQRILESIKTAGFTVMLIQLVGAITKPAEVLAALSKSIRDVGGSFKTLIKGAGEVFTSISGLIGNIGSVVKELAGALHELQTLVKATAILEIALAIAVLAGAIYLLSKAHASEATSSLVGFVEVFAILLSLVGSVAFLKKIKSTAKIWEKAGESVKDIATGMLEMAAAILVIALALKLLSTIKTDDMLIAFAVVEVMLVTLAGIAKLLQGKSTKTTGLKSLWSGTKTETGDMTKGLTGLIAMAFAVKIAAKAIASLAEVDQEAMLTGAAVVEVLMGSMALIVKWLSGDKAAKMAKGATMLLAMAVAVRLLTKPVMEFASLNSDALMQGVLAVGGLMIALGMLLKFLSGTKGAIKNGLGILLIAEAIKILQDTVVAFSQINSDSLLKGLLGVVALLGGIAIAMDLLDPDKILLKVAAVGVISLALQNLAEVIGQFAEDPEGSLNGLMVLAAALFVLFGAVEVFSKAPIAGILKLFVTLAMGAIIVAAFGAAIGVFGIGVSIFGAGLTSLASGCAAVYAVLPAFLTVLGTFIVSMMLLSTIGLPAVAVILALSIAFLALGAGMALMGSGMQNIATAIKLMSDMEGKLKSTAKSVVKFTHELTKMGDDADAVEDAATSMAKSISKIANTALKARTNIHGMTTVGKNMAEAIKKGFDSGAKAVETAVSNLVNKATAKLRNSYNSWYSVGHYLISGMVAGIASQQGALEAQVCALEEKARRAVEAKAKIKSPSRVWMQIGAYMGEGLAIGIRNSGDMVVAASEGLAETSEEAVRSAITSIADAMDSDLDSNLTIKPVVDLSDVTASAEYINSRFGSMGLGASLAGAISGNIQNGGKDSAITKLAHKLDSMTEAMNSRSLNNYITIDGSADPEGFADDLIRSFRLNARTV